MRRSARSMLVLLAALAVASPCPALPSQPAQDAPAAVNPARIVQVAATVRFVRERVAEQGPALDQAARLRETCATLGALGFKVPSVERLSPDVSNVELATAVLTGKVPLPRPAAAASAKKGARPTPGQPTDPSLPEFFVDGTADDDVVTNATVRPTIIAVAPPAVAPIAEPIAEPEPAPAPPLVAKVRSLLAARDAERAAKPQAPAAGLDHAKDVMERLRSRRAPQATPASQFEAEALPARTEPPTAEPLFELVTAKAPAPAPEPVFDVAAPDADLVVERPLPAPAAPPAAPSPVFEVAAAEAAPVVERPLPAPEAAAPAATAADPTLHAAVAALLRRLHDEAEEVAAGAPLPLNAAVLASWRGLGLPAPATLPADLEALPPARLAGAVLEDLDEDGRRGLRDDLRLLFPADARGL